MREVPAFSLWLEFEEWTPEDAGDPTDDFCNVLVRLADGRSYGVNVWTFGFMRRARYPWPYQEGVGEAAEYLLPPDLFVARLDRPTLERAIAGLLAEGDLPEAWLSDPREADDHSSSG